MAKVFIEESTLTAIGDAIRSKTSTTAKLSPTAMPAKIESIQTGGGGYVPTDAELRLSGDMTNAFAANKFNWVIDNYGDRIYMDNCYPLTKMFKDSHNLKKIPFVVRYSNATNTLDVSSIFYGCESLTELPTIAQWRPVNANEMFYGCYNLREIPDSFVNAIDWSTLEATTSAYASNCSSIFKHCKSLRKVPAEMLHFPNANDVSYIYLAYYQAFYYCTVADEILNVPVYARNLSSGTSVLRNTFWYCHRVKDITFAPFDGTVNWNSVDINLTADVGWCGGNISDRITGYNSGITRDKEVTDDASYQALKDDPDWFTCDVAYSRYNHDSAVNTINSLPTTTGTGCTITFWGTAGSKTDGGAINTLTDAEIAVAAAKGWTVAFN